MQERVPFQKAIGRLRRSGSSMDEGARPTISGEESIGHVLVRGMVGKDELVETSLGRTKGSRFKVVGGICRHNYGEWKRDQYEGGGRLGGGVGKA